MTGEPPREGQPHLQGPPHLHGPAGGGDGEPADAAPRPGSAGRLALALLAVVAVVMAGLFVAVLLDPSSTAVSLEPGECLRAPEETQIVDVDRVDCDDPHEFEVFATVELPDGPYPGDQQVFEIAMAACQPRLEAYSGAPPDPTGWLVNVFTPSREGWDEGDRGATCLAYRFDEEQFFGTVQGSARVSRG